MGKFIVFEGGEGTGKTTQIKLLEEKLNQKNIKVFLTREPGGTDCLIAEKIRNLIKDPQNKEMVSRCELFLFLASRAQHIEQIVKKYLAQDYFVICDRFFGSTIAYQHFARGLFEYEEIKSLNNFATQGVEPDLTLLLDIDPQIGLTRISDRRDDDRLDSEKLDFHKKVQQGYLTIAQKESNWKVIDASSSIEKIQEQIWEQVKGLV